MKNKLFDPLTAVVSIEPAFVIQTAILILFFEEYIRCLYLQRQ
jgi:hypothetical protein